MKYEIVRRNKEAAALLQVSDETGPRALIGAGPLGDFDRQDQTGLVEWVRKACEQFEAVNPDEPFPVATARRRNQGVT